MTSQEHRHLASLLRGSARSTRVAHDTALHKLGLAIVGGEFPSGSLLPAKPDLMAWLDVSHTTLREAMQTIAAKGMIVARAKVGTRVLDQNHWNMFDADVLSWRLEVGIPTSLLGMLLEIRQSLEPLAAALAAANRTDAELEQLRLLLAAMQHGVGKRRQFVESDVAFHKFILVMSGNAFMSSMAALTSTALSVSFGLSAPYHDPDLARTVYRQHEDIVEAIARRDSQAASDAMTIVIKQGWRNHQAVSPVPIATLELLRFPAQD